VGAVDFAHEDVERVVDDHLERKVARQHRLKGADHRTDLEAHQFLKQRLLVLEVEIDRALGDAGAARHVVEPRGGKAAFGEFVERRL
jgi:hypothetical protein